jgi:predicted small lipoprotein YifL
MNKKQLFLMLMLILLSGCGQTGPLYLPAEPVQDARVEKTAAANQSVNDTHSDQE